VQVINPEEKLSRFQDLWNPRIVAELNDDYVKLVKVRGEFVWHRHDEQDELFLVVRGRLTIELRERRLELGPGELCVIPRGVEHRPRAEHEAHVLLIEPKGTRNTGDVDHALTRERLERV